MSIRVAASVLIALVPASVAASAQASTPPTLLAFADPPRATAPADVFFSATGLDPDGSQLTYKWTFADGAAFGSGIERTYTQPGRYWAEIKVTDGQGESTTKEVGVVVMPPSSPPKAGLGDSPMYTFDEYRLSDRAVVKVNVANGNLLVQEIDVDRTDTDFEHDVTRSYNSQKGYTGHEGALVQTGWTHDLGRYDTFAKEQPTGDVDVYLPSGRELRFTKSGSTYTAPAKSNLHLTLDGSEFVLTGIASEDEYRFTRATSGRPAVSELRSVLMGAHELTRAPGQATITDSLGRTTSFTFVPGTDWATAAGEAVFEYDVPATSRHWPTKLVRARAADNSWSTDYAYNAQNRLSSISTAGHTIQIGYDGSGRVSTITEIASGAPNQTSTYSYPSGATQRTAPSGRVTSTQYTGLEISGSTSGSAPPTLSLGGSLYAARGTELTEESLYGLSLTAGDGNGVASVAFLVDGQVEDEWNPMEEDADDPAECAAPCTTYSTTLSPDASDWGSGWHEIAVAVTNAAGSVRTVQFRVAVPQVTFPEIPVPGDVEPAPALDAPLDDAPCIAEFGSGSPYCGPEPLDDEPFSAFAPVGEVKWGIADAEMRNLELLDGHDGNPATPGGPVSFLDDPHFQALQVKRVRVMVPWNLMEFPRRVQAFKRFYKLAIDQGRQITVSFQFSCDADIPDTGRHSCYREANYNRIPTKDAYVRRTRQFKERFKRIPYLAAWNEPNHEFQPTRRSNESGPHRAALYAYLLERYVCSRAREGSIATNPCEVVAGEIAPGKHSMKYLNKYRKELREFHEDTIPRTRMPRIWSYHPYGDILRERKNRKATKTWDALNRIPEGAKLWFLEAGSHRDERTKPINRQAAQAREVRYLTHTLVPWYKRVTRVYYYQFCNPVDPDTTSNPEPDWDTGLMRHAVGAGLWCTGPRDAYHDYQDATLENPMG